MYVNFSSLSGYKCCPRIGGVLWLVGLQELAIKYPSFEYLKTYESEPKHQIN